MWGRGGQGGRNGETPGGLGLWPPGPFLGGGGGGPFRTGPHPSHSWEGTQLSPPLLARLHYKNI